MKNNFKTLTLLFLTSLGLMFSNPAQAQRSSSCSNQNQEQPSQDRREITNAEYGLRFEIPANYRTELRRANESSQLQISVRNPTDVEYLNCISGNVRRGDGHAVSDVVISVEPLPDGIRTIQDIWPDVFGRSGIEIINSGVITVDGRNAAVYTQLTLYPMLYRYVKLIHPDGQSLIVIYAGDYGEVIDPIDLEVMNMITSSLRIEP